MNEKQRRAFEALNEAGKRCYYELEYSHPDWNINKRLAKAKIECLIDKDEDDEDDYLKVIKKVLDQFKNWCRTTLPDIFASIGNALQRAIDAVGEAIRKGWDILVSAAESAWEAVLRFFS